MKTQQKQQGVSLVAAIFLMVTLASLGTYIASITTFQNVSSTLSLQYSRAYSAALGGIEWAAWYVRTNDACASNADATFTIGQLNVEQDSCSATSVTEGNSTYNIFLIEYTASTIDASFGDPEFASSTIRSKIMGQP